MENTITNTQIKNKTKFAILPIIICSFVTITPLGLFYLTINSSTAGIFLPILLLIFVIFFWLTEFRTRAHKIEIQNEKIIVSEYFGLGKNKVFKLKDLMYYFNQVNLVIMNIYLYSMKENELLQFQNFTIEIIKL